jgi:hypothetical protein
MFQQEREVEKLCNRGNDVIFYLKPKNEISSYPAFWLSDCGTEKMHVMFYKFSKRQMKIAQRNL